MKKDTEKNKARVLEALKQSMGLVTTACRMANISAPTFYNWLHADASFKASVDEIMELQCDNVEGMLFKKIAEGDTTAAIFYLKTKGRKRGYVQNATPNEDVVFASDDATDKDKDEQIRKLVSHKEYEIKKILKSQGRYVPELAIQVKVVAQLYVKTEMMAAKVLSSSHSPVVTEISREGNKRESVSQDELIYQSYVDKLQSGLRRLGMNLDAKQRIEGGDESQDIVSRVNNLLMGSD